MSAVSRKTGGSDDTVCDLIAKELDKGSWRNIREKRWKVNVKDNVARTTGTKHLQPDLSTERLTKYYSGLR